MIGGVETRVQAHNSLGDTRSRDAHELSYQSPFSQPAHQLTQPDGLRSMPQEKALAIWGNNR
jgi:hypothetical protein